MIKTVSEYIVTHLHGFCNIRKDDFREIIITLLEVRSKRTEVSI